MKKIKIILIIITSLILLNNCMLSENKRKPIERKLYESTSDPWNYNKSHPKRHKAIKPNANGPVGVIWGGAVRQFKEVWTKRDGARCPFYPTCSSYAMQAIRKYGPILGFLFAIERLFLREGGNFSEKYIRKPIGKKKRYIDPLP